MRYANQYISRSTTRDAAIVRREKLPEVPPPRLSVEGAVSFLVALGATKLKGEVSLPVIEARAAACLECVQRGQYSIRPDEIGYCLGCKCGGRKRAALTKRIRMRKVKRPVGCLWPSGDDQINV